MPSLPFLHVRIVAPETAFGTHTRANPGSRIDAVVESYDPRPGGVQVKTLAHVRDLPPPAFEALRAQLEARYGDVQVEAANPEARSWLLRCTAQVPRFTAAGRSMAEVQQRFAIPWVHAEAGRITLRAEATGADGGREEAGRIQAFLEEQGIEGDVRCGPVPQEDLGAWLMLRALVEARRGDGGTQPSWQRLGRVRDLP